MALKPIQILINAKDNASAVFTSLQAKVASVGAAIASYFGIKAFAGVVSGAADFESAMSRVQAATGASKAEMAELTKAAQDAGANTKYTSVEAAGALENLAKAGLTAKQAIATLPGVLQLAQAGNIGLAESSELVTKVIMGMGLAFEDAGRVADVLALGANATNTSVLGLAQALSYAAPVANSLGLSLESTVAIVGKFADAGIDASRAGTALNSILSQFSNPASKFRRELADINITTGDFGKALHQLAAAGPRGADAINAVGQEAGPALRALLNQGMGALDDLNAKLQNASGSAAATAKVMQDNLNGSLNGLASAWQTVKDVLGTPVLPVIKEGVDQLAGALRGAVADGTIQRFGETIAVAFQNGMKWVREFVGSVDFAAVLAKKQSWADEVASTMDRIGESATNASNIVKTAWGVMTAGTTTVMAVIFKVAEAFAGVASNIQSGVALIAEGFSKVTFGELSKSFKSAADEIRLSAEATWAVSEAFAEKSDAAFEAATRGARLAQEGFAGLTESMRETTPAAQASGQAIARVAEELARTADANNAARQAAEKKAAADLAARQAAEQHSEALAKLRADYQRLIQEGNLDEAGKKLQEINKHLRDTANAGQNAGRAAQEAAEQLKAAFDRLGVVSSQALKDQAANAKRDFETIKNSGVATAEDIAAAFKKAAEDAIAANKGIAPSWVTAEAGVHGFRIAVDKAGQATVVSMKEAETAVRRVGFAAREAAGEFDYLGQRIEYTSERARQLHQQGQILAAQLEEMNARAGASSIMNRKDTIKEIDAVPDFESMEQAEAWMREFEQQYARKNPFTTRNSGALGAFQLSNVRAEWQAQVDAMRLRSAGKVTPGGQGGGIPAPAPTPAPAAPLPGGSGGSSSGSSSGVGSRSGVPGNYQITINVHGVNDPAKLARMLQPELERLALRAR